MDYLTAYMLIGVSLLIGTPFFILFGWLSDKIGRRNIILFGLPDRGRRPTSRSSRALTHYVNPALEAYQKATKISVAATDCNFHIFVAPGDEVLATATRPRTS